MPNIIMADAKTGAPQWKTLTPTSQTMFADLVNMAHIIPPDNCVVYLRLNSERKYISGVPLLGYVITIFDGAVRGANLYAKKSASEENPVIPNETSFFTGDYIISNGNWKLNSDGALYRSASDATLYADEAIKYLIVEVPSPDSFLPGVNI